MSGGPAREWGDRTAPPLVLLHPIATDGSIWLPQVLTLSARHRVIALDLPGHGEATVAAGPPTIAAMGERVAAACAALGVARAAFAGLSLGSMVVQWLAASRPELVSAAVLANGACTLPKPAREAWHVRIAAVAQGGMATQVDPTIERWFTPGFRSLAPQAVAAVARLVRATSPSGFTYGAAAIATLDQAELVRAIRCPALVLAGEHDAAAPPPVLMDLADRIPGAEFRQLPAAHLANVEAPVAFNECVADFLSRTMP